MGFEQARVLRRETSAVIEGTTAQPVRGGFKRSAMPLPRFEEASMPAVSFPTEGTRIQRRWERGGGGTITTTSGAFKKGFNNCVDHMDEVPSSIGTIIRVDKRGNSVAKSQEYVRIDLQEFTDAGWLNIQCQAGNTSMAGILCPPGLPLATLLAGIRLAIAGNCMYTWVPDDDGGTTGGKNQGGGGKGPDKGGKKGPDKSGGRRGGQGGNKGGGGFQVGGGQQIPAY